MALVTKIKNSNQDLIFHGEGSDAIKSLMDIAAANPGSQKQFLETTNEAILDLHLKVLAQASYQFRGETAPALFSNKTTTLAQNMPELDSIILRGDAVHAFNFCAQQFPTDSYDYMGTLAQAYEELHG